MTDAEEQAPENAAPENAGYEMAFEQEPHAVRDAFTSDFWKYGAVMGIVALIAAPFVVSSGLLGGALYVAATALIGGGIGGSIAAIRAQGQAEGAEQAVEALNDVLAYEAQPPELPEKKKVAEIPVHKTDHAAKLLEQRAAQIVQEQGQQR